MTDSTNRISALERKTINLESDIHEIKDDVHHIKKDVEDGKRVTDMNTKELKDTNKILNDMHIAQIEGLAMLKGGVTTLKFVWKITKWIATVSILVASAYLTYRGIT